MNPGGWGGWGGGGEGGHQYPIVEPGSLSFNGAHLRALVQGEDLEGVDYYLASFVRAEDPEIHLLDNDADPGILNPSLVLHVRGEELLARIRAGNHNAARSFYDRWILPLRNVQGSRVPYSDFVRIRVDSLGDRIQAEDGSSVWPNQQAKDRLKEQLLDHIRLYYPVAIGHNMLTHRRRKPIWNLSMILTDANNEQIYHNGKWMYRCLACNDWDTGRHRGIKQLEYHLVGDRVGKNLPCPMTTPRLFQLLGVEDPHIVPNADGDEANILPDPNNQVPNQQDVDLEDAGNQSLGDQQDVDGALNENQDANAPARPPQGFMEASAVLHWHQRISPQLDLIVRSLANEPLPALDPLASRVRLQRILGWCIHAIPMEGWEVVNAHNVLAEAQNTRHDILGILGHVFPERPQLHQNIETMLNEINTLEQMCFSATAPHVP